VPVITIDVGIRPLAALGGIELVGTVAELVCCEHRLGA
jgi:hypothetical protein